jgi:hypothetical protein
VLEVLAAAWGAMPVPAPVPGEGARAQAQDWLMQRGYLPSVFELGSPGLMWLSALVPWLHSDDHPRDDLDHFVYRVSMPASIEAFVHANVPEATRLEFCHTQHIVVIRRGWEPIAEGCRPDADDTVIALDDPVPALEEAP